MISIVHTYLELPGFYGAVAGKLAGARVITSIRSAGPRKNVGAIGEKLAFLISDRIIANSRAGAGYYFRHFPGMSKTEIIYNGYDFTDFDSARKKSKEELGLPESHPLIGHVANLTYLKDYPTFLRALSKVFDKEPEARAIIVGDGRRRPDYESLARSLGIDDKTIFLGHRQDALDLVRNFDICALASHPKYGEGLSNSIAEYMGLAKPVVATAVGGNKELVRDGETGLLSPGGDADALAENILSLLRDQRMRERMGNRGRQFFEANLTLERMVMETQRVYEQLTRD
jgi:glycosyltransferase involved in cell wall biosynthesis